MIFGPQTVQRALLLFLGNKAVNTTRITYPHFRLGPPHESQQWLPASLYLQQMGISGSSMARAASSEEEPVASPLSFLPTTPDETPGTQKALQKPDTVRAVLKKIKQSPKKVNLVAALIRGMRVQDALLQLEVLRKRAADTLTRVIKSARANAGHNHGLDPDRLLIAEAYVGKGEFVKRISYHSKGRHGILEKPECRVTIIVRELNEKDEAIMARLKRKRCYNIRKLNKREKRLVPHTLIESNPTWHRKPRTPPPPHIHL